MLLPFYSIYFHILFAAAIKVDGIAGMVVDGVGENSTDNGPDPHKKDGEYISRVVPHWEEGTLDWIPLCKHHSDWPKPKR